MNIVVLHHQSLLDLAVQHTGSVENAFILALQNGKSLTDDLEAGETLNLEPTTINQNKDILNYYQSKKLQPATGVSHTGGSSLQLQGIGYWVIQTDFKVS